MFFLTLSKNYQRLAPYSSKYFSESPQSPTEAAIGGPLRACRAKMAFLVEEAVPVQEAVRVLVVGEELTVKVLVAVVLAGGEAGHRGEEVLGQSLTLSRVATLVFCIGCCEYYQQDHHQHCHSKP